MQECQTEDKQKTHNIQILIQITVDLDVHVHVRIYTHTVSHRRDNRTSLMDAWPSTSHRTMSHGWESRASLIGWSLTLMSIPYCSHEPWAGSDRELC